MHVSTGSSMANVSKEMESNYRKSFNNIKRANTNFTGQRGPHSFRSGYPSKPLSERMEVLKKVGVLGPKGSQSHNAAISYGKTLNTPLKLSFFENLPKVFDSLTNEKCSHILVPIRNSLSGPVEDSAKLMHQYRDRIEVLKFIDYPIRFSLLGLSSLDISVVMSHKQALMQCKRFLRESMPWARSQVVSSTAEAARIVAESKDSHVGAIASPEAANIYGLTVLASGIEDDGQNYTQFALLQRRLA